MDKVNVLVVSRLDLKEGYMEEIAAVDPRISVKDGIKQFVAELRRQGNKEPFVNLLGNLVRQTPSQKSTEETEDLDILLAQAEVIFGMVLLPENLLSRAPRLKWLHLGSTGIDHYLSTGIFDSNITVTNSRGSLAIPIAEYVLTAMCMLAKNARHLLYNQQKRLWQPFSSKELRGSTVGIIGLGTIGSEVARLARGVGLKVLATRESATRRESGVFGVDELYPPSDLHQMLSESDYVVIAVPLTTETERMIGEVELRIMKPTAYLINIARGPIIDQSALIRALRESWIAGAALDVFDFEPLPNDSELWELPNVILSPHTSGATDKRGAHVLDMFCDNLRRYLAGNQLCNIVDIHKGY